MTRFQKLIFRFFGYFHFFGYRFIDFEILSLYPNFDTSHWLKNDVQWIIDERWSFQRKVFGLNVFDTFFSHFSTEFLVFWFLPVLVVFIVIRLIVMSCWLPVNNKRHFSHIGLYFSVFFDFPCKLVILMAVKTLKIIFRKKILNNN